MTRPNKRSRLLPASPSSSESFAATFGIAAAHFLEDPLQVVVIEGDSDAENAKDLYAAAVAPFSFGKSTLRLAANQAVAQNLPPVLAETIPNLPQVNAARRLPSFAPVQAVSLLFSILWIFVKHCRMGD